MTDANDYYPGRDGHVARIGRGRGHGLAPARYAHIRRIHREGLQQRFCDRSPKGRPARRYSQPLRAAHRGRWPRPKQSVADFLNAISFAAVDVGGLNDSWVVERDTLAYLRRATVNELRVLASNVERVIFA